MTFVSYIRPFDGRQVVYVLDESTKDTVDTVTTSLNGYSDTIMDLLKVYSVRDLHLHGATQFCKKIKEEIETKELTRYASKKLNIHITGE